MFEAMNPFEKMVLKALALLLRAALWHNAFGTASDWNKDAKQLVADIEEQTK